MTGRVNKKCMDGCVEARGGVGMRMEVMFGCPLTNEA